MKNLNLNMINNIRSKAPGITHVDNSARIQSVNNKDNPIFNELIRNSLNYLYTNVNKNTLILEESQSYAP